MTKRFTPKAGQYTARLAEVQKEVAALKAKVRLLEEEADELVVFLKPFYDLGYEELEYGNKVISVDYSTFTRKVFNQYAAQKLLLSLNKRPPMKNLDIIKFNVKIKD